jgi:hypothetical protein
LDDFPFPGHGNITFTDIYTQIERDDAEFGRWNGAVFESGMHRARALAAPARCAAGMLQQLRRAAAQRAAAAAAAFPDARATNEELPAGWAPPLKFLRG